MLKLSGSMFTAKSWEWRTPALLYEDLDAEFHFDLDPCPIGGSDNGLSPLFVSWTGRRVFCNPPYGPGIKEWLARAPEAEIAVFLLPARTDTAWFHDLCLSGSAEIRFLRGRLRFNDAGRAPFPSMLVIFRK